MIYLSKILEDSMKLYNELFGLKKILRRGWILRNAYYSDGRCESDAEHIFSMSMLAFEILEKEKLDLDRTKVYEMILCHEVGEIEAGDITIVDNVPKKVKYDKELACVQRIANSYNMHNMLKLWREFEENTTPEAKFVKQIDKLDSVMQAKIYAQHNSQPQLFEEFYNGHKDEIDPKYLKYIDDEI